MKALGPGARIADRYFLETVIAKGGMGAVYRAIDERLGRTVAIKILLEELAEDETTIARFEREATVSARLTHPAVVQMFDFGKHDGVSYIVMELVVGRTLATELDQKKRIEPERACDLIEQALGGIGAAHEAGIVHRDLKPGNIMIIPTGTGREVVKVLDFGIAQLKESAPYARLTRSGAVLGTPTFMSPEQARGETCDPRTDVYAMGVVLWCCLTGQRPFQGPDVPTILGKVMNEMPPRADRIDPKIPAAIAHATERAMEKRPSARYPTAAAFAQALIEASQAGAIPATAGVSLPTESRGGVDEASTREMPMFPGIAAAATVSSPGIASAPTSAGPMTREPSVTPIAPASASPPSWRRWVAALAVLGVLGGVVLGVLIVLGVVEFEREGADLRGLSGPVIAPPVPSSGAAAPPSSAPMATTVGANGAAPTASTCEVLYGCCNAYRERVQPQFPDCDQFVGQLDGDPQLCAQRITMFQGLAASEGRTTLPECAQP